MNIDELKRWLDDPSTYRTQLSALMEEDPWVLAPYPEKLAPYMAFTRKYTSLVDKHHRRYVYGNFVDSDFMARLLNAGVQMDWPEWRWRKATKSEIPLNGQALVQMPKLGMAAGDWASDCFAGFENEDDAVDAVQLIDLSKRVGVIDQIADAYAKVPTKWWERIAPAIPHPKATWTLVRKLKWRTRSYIYSHMTTYQKDRSYLPGSVYGTRQEALERKDPGIVFNRNVRLDDKLKYLGQEEALVEWLSSRHLCPSVEVTKNKPLVPKHIWCPGSVTLNIKNYFLDDREMSNLYELMRVFFKLKLTGAIQAFEHMLNPESPMGADFVKWKEQGRIK